MKKLDDKTRLMAVGVLTLAAQRIRDLKDLERTLAALLEVPPELGDYYGHVSDAIYSGGDIDIDELVSRVEAREKMLAREPASLRGPDGSGGDREP